MAALQRLSDGTSGTAGGGSEGESAGAARIVGAPEGGRESHRLVVARGRGEGELEGSPDPVDRPVAQEKIGEMLDLGRWRQALLRPRRVSFRWELLSETCSYIAGL